MSSHDVQARRLERVAAALQLLGGPGEARRGLCPKCDTGKFLVTYKGFVCGGEEFAGCGWQGTTEELVQWLERRQRAAITVRLADVEPAEVRWLWPGRIPLGRLTVLDGDPGLGKSALTLDIAARVTRGDLMPDGSRGISDPRGVVLLGCEDGLADTVRPRLDAARADVTMVVALEGVPESDGRARLPTVEDSAEIAQAAQQVDAAMLVVDPLSAFLGRDVDGHRDTDVRQALASLAKLAERTGIAVFAVRHLTKGGGSNPLYRGGGSIAMIAAARSGLLLAPDPENAELRVLASSKCNLAPPQESLSLRIEPKSETLVVSWLGRSERSAEELLDPSTKGRPARSGATELLRDQLRNGPQPVHQLKQAAAAAGFGWRTLERAKAELGVTSVKLAFDGRWAWRLPYEDRHRSTIPQVGSQVAVFEDSPPGSRERSLGNDEERQGQPLAVFDGEPTAAPANDVDRILAHHPDNTDDAG